MDDFRSFFIEFQDFGAPRLGVYEQAIYLYIARHTLAIDTRETLIGFKSARKKMAFGSGKAGTAPSEAVVYEKLKSLEAKGFIKIISSERNGTRINISKPSEIEGVVPSQDIISEAHIDEIDFYTDSENRERILVRESHKCFYCLRALDHNNYVIEHVVSRPFGNNSYRNLVASCRQCNNRKDASSADDYLRMIYREGLLSQGELQERQVQLETLLRGDLKPTWPG